jgi:hypothetical protein
MYFQTKTFSKTTVTKTLNINCQNKNSGFQVLMSNQISCIQTRTPIFLGQKL